MPARIPGSDGARSRSLPALPDEIARPWLGAVLREREGNESFLVRAAAIRPLIDRATEWATELLEACIEDPSSLVRLTLAEECARGSIEPSNPLGRRRSGARIEQGREGPRRDHRVPPEAARSGGADPLPGTRRRSAGRTLRRGRDRTFPRRGGARRRARSIRRSTPPPGDGAGDRASRRPPPRAARGRSCVRRHRARARNTPARRIAGAGGSAGGHGGRAGQGAARARRRGPRVHD